MPQACCALPCRALLLVMLYKLASCAAVQSAIGWYRGEYQSTCCHYTASPGPRLVATGTACLGSSPVPGSSALSCTPLFLHQALTEVSLFQRDRLAQQLATRRGYLARLLELFRVGVGGWTSGQGSVLADTWRACWSCSGWVWVCG